ncbi:putative uncharacterized protein DDB_G0271606 [Drosophila grimshawi]|uniref:GH14617 n=1 Tax=Drosophila grimshawi TaxID=7222 RepID=B4IY36_DROGR|nr:putative uncharacterized protein DDB_G0271606 [Drosophila grimshawi]EDV97579.1 GH14617 [Drosophila grimshawi]
METLQCASEAAQIQEHQQHQQRQTDALANIKRVSLPFVSQSQMDTDTETDAYMAKAEDVSQMVKQKPQHAEALVGGSSQLVNLGSTHSLYDNVVSIPKELILISLVSQEQALYNPKHQLYRSTKSKDEKWTEIGSRVGWTDTQCKGKWKAMRDQYCRELKRAKLNTKGNVKWKYFKELDFLRPYALARNYRSRGAQNGHNATIFITATLPYMTSTDVATTNNSSGIHNNGHNNTTNNNNSFSNSNSSSQNLNLSAEPSKFANIKIEDRNGTMLENCTFVAAATTTVSTAATATATTAANVDKKPDATRGLMSALMAGQMLEHQQQQQQPHQDTNWNYLSDASGNGVGSTTTMTVTCETPNQTLYNDFVDCVNAASAVNQNSTRNNQSNADEDDDDPIHTYLNLESYFEKELITLIEQEDMIYNYSNQNYRNVKLKHEVWDEIARKLKKPVKQCRQKWKALRDQYAREYKRLKTQLHMDVTSRWKHYDSLGFLQKYIQQKSLDGDTLGLLLPKHEAVGELDEHLGTQSPLRHSEPQVSTLEASPSSSSQLNMSTLPPLTGPTKAELSATIQQQQQQQQQEVQQASELCVASYDEMDIENYINGDVVHDDDEEDENEDMDTTATTEEPTQQQQQQQHVVSYENNEDSVYMAVQSVSNALSKPDQQLNETGSSLEPQQLQQHQLQTASEYAQPKLEVHTPTSTRFQNSANTPSTASQALFPLGACSMATEEDEIGAFFKAVAMKIRKAHLEPVAFTDLQINILGVINEALRNH